MISSICYQITSLTSESELCGGLHLPVSPGDEALVDPVVLPLQVVDLQGLLVETDPVVGGQHQPVLPPEYGGPVPLLGQALHVGRPPDVNDLLGRDQVWSGERALSWGKTILGFNLFHKLLDGRK